MHPSPFLTRYEDILERLQGIDPVRYARTRNYLTGAVTRLSPYISRGMISTRELWQAVASKGFNVGNAEKFLQELAWREYFQRVWQALGDELFTDIRFPQQPVRHREMPTALVKADTGVLAINRGIQELYQTGYMHNHLRMYTASMACNIAQAHWKQPAAWMYYHLYDGDLASNTCSWQWVAGSFSSKKYYCNQENINRYTGTNDSATYLDASYEALMSLSVPAPWLASEPLQLHTNLPDTPLPAIDANKPLLIYNSYNLDPLWRANESVNRVLLLEPTHFNAHPVSNQVLKFLLALADNIKNLQVFTGSCEELSAIYEQQHKNPNEWILSKEHPAFGHYPGKKDPRHWLFPEVSGYYPSFSAYWNKCKKYLRHLA